MALVCGAACGDALAQFYGAPQPSRGVELLMRLPWLFVVAVLVLGWLGPRALRPILRRASKHALAAYLGMASMLFVTLLVFRSVFGPETEPVFIVLVLFLGGLGMSGAVIAAFMVASAVFSSARLLFHRREACACWASKNVERTR